MKTILVLNQKGGVSKTSVCVELASFLTQFPTTKKGANVLAIDMDAQQHFSKYVSADVVLEEEGRNGKIKESKNAIDVLLANEFILDAVQTIEVPRFLDKTAMSKAIYDRRQQLAADKKAVKENSKSADEANKKCKELDEIAKKEIAEMKKQVFEEENPHPAIDVLPASKRLSSAGKMFIEEDDEYLLREILHDEEVQEKYDYCIIDSAPARSPLLSMSIIAADYIIIPTDRDPGAIDGIENTLQDIEVFMNKHETSAKILGIYMTRFEKAAIQTVLEEDIMVTAEDYGISVFDSFSKNSPISKESRLSCQSVAAYKSNCSLAYEYYDFVKETLEKIKECEE